MKTVVLVLICLLGSAFTTPTSPLNYQFGAHGKKTAEKTKYTHSETPEEEDVGSVNKGDVSTSGHRTIKAEVPVLDTQRDEPWAARRQGRGGGEHQTKNSLRSINFLTLHSNSGLASDNWESNSGSKREQPSSEHRQPRRHKKHSNMAGQQALRRESPADALGLVRELNTWKYNKNAVGLDENNSESDEEEAGGDEDEEWGEETDYRDMKHRAHGTSHGRQYRSWQSENSHPPGEFLRDSSLPVRITKRHGEKFSIEEESHEKPYKEGKLPLSKKNRNEDQSEKRESQKSKEHAQVNDQHKQEEVMKRQDKEGSNAEEDDNDSGDDGEEDLSNVWREAAYEEEERMQSNAQDSINDKQKEEGNAGDDSGVYRELQDYQGDKIKDITHSKDDHYHHEPPNSSSKRQLQSSSAESMNSTESEHEVKTTGGSYNEESARNSTGKDLPGLCRNFHCKRGKVCQADKQGKPSCICQDPAACPSTKDYERVCGTDNKTYDGTCQLFGTKCQLEGTKMGRQLHLDYMGACKYIPHCTDYEVNQFPLRMRDWLKNILMQYYERDQDKSGFLTEKQRNKVKKIYLNEKRLVSGEHPVELLLRDFEKNYHMYVYPVHWQFYQLDQHPTDKSLTHSELAPLRASLVPMEHCITRFFQECDGDQDKLITLKEWCHCFGIKEEDINESLLF